jgi:hypothetical protein
MFTSIELSAYLELKLGRLEGPSVGVREYIFLNMLLDILEVSSHSCLEELLGVTNVDLSRSITFDFVDDNWDLFADITVLAGFRRGSAATVSCFKIE